MPAAVDRVIFSTDCVTIGAFRCPLSHPSFRNSGPTRDDCFVFPRTTVLIQHENARAFVADPPVITLYNRRDEYEPRPVSADGDRCDWFAVSLDVFRAALLDRDPSAAEAERPIRFAHAPTDAFTYFEQRRLFIDATAATSITTAFPTCTLPISPMPREGGDGPRLRPLRRRRPPPAHVDPRDNWRRLRHGPRDGRRCGW